MDRSVHSWNSRRDWRGGFTLVELLVVIAVIALLVAMLIPSLRGAKEMTRTSVGQAQMKTVGVAMAGYQTDNNWRIVPSRSLYDDGSKMYWLQTLYEAGLVDGVRSETDEVTQANSAFRCPSEIPEERLGGLAWGEPRSIRYRTHDSRKKVTVYERINSSGAVEYYSMTSFGINGGNMESNTWYRWEPKSLAIPHKWWGNGRARGSIRHRDKDWFRSNEFREVAAEDVISLYDGILDHVSSADSMSARHYHGTINVLMFDGHTENHKSEDISSTYYEDERDASLRPTHWFDDFR